MPTRTYGTRYQAGRDVTHIARDVRTQIKTWTKDGTLPADWTWSVRISRFAGGRSIDVTGTSPRPIMLMEPGFVAAPKDARRTVRVPIPRRGSDGARQWPGEWMDLQLHNGEVHEVRWCDSQTDEALAAHTLVGGLLRSFNYDGSDSQSDYFDVCFYGHVVLDVAAGDRWAEARPSYLPVVAEVGPRGVATKHSNLAGYLASLAGV